MLKLDATHFSREEVWSLLDNATDGVWYWDIQQDTVRWSMGLFRHLGYSESEAASLADVVSVTHPDDLHIQESAIADTVENGTPYDIRVRLRRADDTYGWVDVRGVMERDERGEPHFMLGYVLDVTAEQDARRRADATDRLRSLGELAGGIAHDCNNMLGVVLGFTEMVRGGLAPDSEQHELLGEVVKAAERSAELVKQLLGFARQQPIHPQRLDLVECVEDSSRLLRKLIGENIDLRVEAEGDPDFVSLDRSQLDQILTNLCANARDAIGGIGTITIRVSPGEGRADGGDDVDELEDGVLLTVTDSGKGMSEEVRAQIFEPFFTTKPIGRGNGLGMSTVYGIVQQNHGEIDVESAPDRGTTVRIWLPRAEATPEPRSTPRDPSVRIPVDGVVAVVEDEPALLKLTRRSLEGLGYEVAAFGGPEAALAGLPDAGERPAILITDVVMPVMSGPDLVAALRERFPGLRAVFMSGYARQPSGEELDPGGLAVSLEKPFRIADLEAAMREVLALDR